MNNGTFIDSLRNFIRYGGMKVKIIAFNAIVFLLIQIIDVYARLMEKEGAFSEFIEYIFTLNTDVSIFITQPWALLTSIFAHFTFMHFAFNMIFMYFSGKMFEQIFDQKRLTEEISDCLEKNLKPEGVAVVVEASHLCMQMRGVEKQNSITTTSAFTGVFLTEEKTRLEFMNLIQSKLA